MDLVDTLIQVGVGIVIVAIAESCGGVVEKVKEHPIGSVALRDLTRSALRDFYDAQATLSVAATCHRGLSAAFGYAVRERELLEVNPCRLIAPPQVKRPEPRHLDVEEARRILRVAEGDRLESAIILGLVGGMRIAEVCALRWGDIVGDQVHVTKSSWGPTKNGMSRTFTLPTSHAGRMRRLKIEQAERLLLLGIRQSDATPVVAKRDGTSTAPQTLGALFSTFAAAQGFKVSFHALRHTAAILLLSSGVDVKTTAGRLGHNPALLLRTYAHYVPSADRGAADRLGAALAF